MCLCKEIWIEELHYRTEGWNYLPTHTKCGKMVSREQLVDFFRPTGSSVEDRLMRQGRYAEVFLMNWSLVEIGVDECVAYLFGYSSSDEEAEILNEIPFRRKLVYLKDWGVLSKDDYDAIRNLQERRNKIVHSEGWQAKSADYRQIAGDARKAAWMTKMSSLAILYRNKPLLNRLTDGDIEGFPPPPAPSQTRFGRDRIPPASPSATEADGDR